MLRRAFLRRMAFAALATWFLDVPLPRDPESEEKTVYVRWLERGADDWREASYPIGRFGESAFRESMKRGRVATFSTLTVAEGNRTHAEMRRLAGHA